MNDYTTRLLAAGRAADLLREADRERLARAAGSARSATAVRARVVAAFRSAMIIRRAQVQRSDCTSGACAS